nr:MAG TPA: hypothetical protein [Caudoviricetes sp.]
MENEIILLLKKDSEFLPLTPDMVEGKDYIALSSNSDTILGRALSFNNPRKFKTFIGEVSGIRRFVDFIGYSYLPISFLLKGKYTKEDNELIKTKTRLELSNYWAVVCYAVCERIRQDKQLQIMIRNNTLPWTIVYWRKNPAVLEEITQDRLCVNQIKLGEYLAMLRDIEILIKNNKFNKVGIAELIKHYMKNPEADLFEGSIILGSNSIR